MNSREKILAAISNNKPVFIDSPVMEIKRLVPERAAALEQFTQTLASIGGTVIQLSDINSIKEKIREARDSGKYVVNTLPFLGEVNEEINFSLDASALESVHQSYIGATLGVAENGAVWIYESQMKNRLLPFICQHLVVCMSSKNIVPTMHEAYQQIDAFKEGYGVFLAGPSKTADIEQSLVIGAHGARSLLVYLINE
jgi:L-lactate dehydrogenase complex protein LldG